MQKEKLFDKTAQDLNLDYELVHKVLSSAFEELGRAVKVHNTVEISGFGILSMSANKILKKLPGYKYLLDLHTKQYNESPNPEDFKQMTNLQKEFENLKYRYEQIKGVPPIIPEGYKKLG